MKCNTNTSREKGRCLLASTIQFSNNHATPADDGGTTPHAPEPEGPARLAVAIREPNSAPHTTSCLLTFSTPRPAERRPTRQAPNQAP